MKNHIIGASRILLRGLFLLLFSAIVWWQWQQIAKMPPRYHPTRITIASMPGETRILGRAELAAAQADASHLRVRRDADGRWWIGNVSESRVVEINRDGRDELLRSVPLESGSRFALAGKVFHIVAVEDDLLRFSDPSGTLWHFDGVKLGRADGRAQIACPAESIFDVPKKFIKHQWRAVAPLWNRLAPLALASLTAVDVGGVVSCDNRLGLPDVPGASARIAKRAPGKFTLGANADNARLVCLLPQRGAGVDGDANGNDFNGLCGSGKLLYDVETALDGVRKMVLGRTQYDVAIGRDALYLMPRSRVQLFADRSAPAGVTWESDAVSVWRWPFALSPWLALAVFGLLQSLFAAWLCYPKKTIPARRALAWSLGLLAFLPLACLVFWLARMLQGGAGLAAVSWSWPLAQSPLQVAATGLGALCVLWGLIHVKKGAMPAAGALRLSAGLLAIALAVLAGAQGTNLGVGWTLVLQACALASVVLLPSPHVRGGLLVWLSFALAALMFSIGAATQLSLGLAGADTGSLRFFQTHDAKIAAGLFAWFALSAYLSMHLRAGLNFQFKWIETALKAITFAALFSLTLQVLTGNEAGVGGFQPVELAKLALILFSAHILAAFMDWNHMLGWARIRLWSKFLLLIALLLGAVMVLLSLVHDFSPLVLLAVWMVGMLISWSLASGKPLGLTLALALMIGAGYGIGYIRADGGADDMPLRAEIRAYERVAVWLRAELHPHSGAQIRLASAALEQGGLTGGEIASPWRLPEVQNDMTPAYYLSRFGALGGVALVLCQVLYMACLLTMGWRAIHKAETGDFRALWLARVGFFGMWSYAFFLAGHFIVSWGSNLSWLPVMGQPMPFLSVAGSMTLLLLVPMQGFSSVPRQGWSEGLDAV